jgi:hypothetical protein
MLKEKIKKVMLEHLKSKGYPNMTPEQIMRELKPMWVKLEELNLIQPGWNFTQFCMIAQEVHLRIQLEEELAELIGKRL